MGDHDPGRAGPQRLLVQGDRRRCGNARISRAGPFDAAGDRIRGHLRVERVIDRRFDRFVMLGEGTVVHARGIQTADTFRKHDESPERSGRSVRLHVGDVADPLLAVPDDAGPLGVPRFSFGVGGRAVVHDSAVGRPGERPVVVHAEAGRIGGRTPLGVVAGFREDAGVEPVSAHRRAVVLELTEAVDLLPRGLQRLGLVGRIRDVGESLAVDLLQHLGQVGLDRIGVAPGEVRQGLGKRPALLLVEVAHREKDPGQDFLVGFRLPRRIDRLPLPLHPPRGVGERAVLLREVRRGKQEDFRLDLRRLGWIVLLGRLPEDRGLRLDVLGDHEPFQLRERGHPLLGVRPQSDRIHAEGDEPLGSGLLAAGAGRVAAVHVVADVHPGVVAVDFRQPGVPEVVFLRGGLGVRRLQQRHHELRIVLPVVHRGPRLFVEGRGRRGLQVLGERLLRAGGRLQIARKDVEGSGDVGRALDVRVAAEGVDAAPRAPHVAEEQLQHGGGPDHLNGRRVLRPSEGIRDRARLLRHARRRHDLADLEVRVLRRSADPLDHFRRVALDVLLQKLEHAARILERRVDAVRLRLRVGLVSPGGLVVFRLARVESGEESVVELEFLSDQVRAIRQLPD